MRLVSKKIIDFVTAFCVLNNCKEYAINSNVLNYDYTLDLNVFHSEIISEIESHFLAWRLIKGDTLYSVSIEFIGYYDLINSINNLEKELIEAKCEHDFDLAKELQKELIEAKKELEKTLKEECFIITIRKIFL